MKTKKIIVAIFAIFNFLLFILSSIGLIVNGTIETDNNLILSYLFQSADFFFGNSFESLQSVYLTIFTCFVGIYFTVLGIIMANLKVAFIDFFKFSIEIEFFLFCNSIFLNFIEIVFIFPQFEYMVLTEISIYVFIMYLIAFIFLAVMQMSVLQNYEMCLNIFARKSKNLDEDRIRYYYNNFLLKCFPGKKNELLEDIYERLNKKEAHDINKIDICLQLLNSINLKNRDDYASALNFLVNQIKSLVATKKYERITELVETYFNVYQKLIFSDKEQKVSYLLNIRDSIYFAMLDNREDDSLKSIYVQIIKNSKNIIAYSLYHCNFNLVAQEIKDFIYMKQILSTYDAFDEIKDIHDKVFIDILCRIANFIKTNNKYYELLAKYINQLDMLEKIIILDIETDLYQEQQINVDFHELIDTRNYYIAILLCYYFCKYPDNIEKILDKFVYCRADEKYTIWKYQNVLNAFDHLTQKDFNEIMNIHDNVNSVEKIKNKLKERIIEIKNNQFEKLSTLDVSYLLDNKIEELMTAAEEDFSSFAKFDESVENISIYKIQSVFTISKRSLIDSSVISYGTNYCSFLKPFLYKYLLNQKNCIIENINTLSKIETLSNSINKLLLPHEYIEYFYQCNIHNIKYLGINTIEIDDIKFELNYLNVQNGLIIKEDDFYSLISLKSLNVLNREEWKKLNDDLIMEVNIEFEFAFNNKTIFYGYRLE